MAKNIVMKLREDGPLTAAIIQRPDMSQFYRARRSDGKEFIVGDTYVNTIDIDIKAFPTIYYFMKHINHIKVGAWW